MYFTFTKKRKKEIGKHLEKAYALICKYSSDEKKVVDIKNSIVTAYIEIMKLNPVDLEGN